MNKVLQFIEQFKKDSKDETVLEDIFTSGYCYHFAILLAHLFGVQDYSIHLMYNPIDNHFAFLDYVSMHAYDITGDLGPLDKEFFDKGWELWKSYRCKDELETGRIIKQCVYKEDSNE